MAAVPITKKLVAFGSNKVYLPKFTIAFVQTPNLSPYHARFLVPLDFSKYDLRDYLFHAYNVKCYNIRSFVKQMPVRDTVEQPRHWFRPESKKYMTVEMELPFVWPQKPENMSPWGKDERQKQQEEEKEVVKFSDASDANEQRRSAANLRRQVGTLLQKGKREKKDVSLDSSIRRKGKENVAHNAEEAKIEKRREERRGTADKPKKESSLKLWEERRQDKITENDDRRKFSIKA